MSRWLVAVALLLGGAAHAMAATWTCERVEVITTTLVLSRCTAAGTYTTGGDAFSDVNVDLCNSEARHPFHSLFSSAWNATAANGYMVIYDRVAHTVLLLTAANSPGAQYAMVELAAGTAIDGTTLSALVNCK